MSKDSAPPSSADAPAAEAAPIPAAFSAHGAPHNNDLLRQTRVYHVQLTVMADNKASVLLTISSILITLSARYLTEDRFVWPAGVLIVFSLLSVVFAALTTMPRFYRGAARPDALPQPSSPRFNLLFFGDYTRLSYDEYLRAMERVLASSSAAYEAQLRELYLLGSFLAHSKYRWLRYGYMSFIAGLAGSALAWAVAVR